MTTRKIDINNWIIKNPSFIDRYEPLSEEGDIIFILGELDGEEREEFIRLEEGQNPLQFKTFREEFPSLFE